MNGTGFNVSPHSALKSLWCADKPTAGPQSDRIRVSENRRVNELPCHLTP